MITINKRLTRIDSLLDSMAEVIQLDNSRYERMKRAYEAVKGWIEDDEKFFKPYKYDVYSHGSVRIRTTVKPLSSDEFDLDIVVHLVADYNVNTPTKVYNELKRRLQENKKYEEILELKNRCLRLNYSGDFHMDIMPGIQENPYDNNKIKVPDRKLNSWVSSNPKGYADWFLSKANLIKESYLEKALRAENLPIDDFQHKKPLQRGVQLIKRYRDEYFQKDPTYKTSSIILTTIAGQFYKGEESIFNTIDGIISSLVNQVNLPLRLKILNPVNLEEDFTDKWDSEPQYYVEFKRFIKHLSEEWEKLKGSINEDELDVILKGLIGESVYNSSKVLVNNTFHTLQKQIVDPYAGLKKLAQPVTTEHKMWFSK
jgi:hypothetical protein